MNKETSEVSIELGTSKPIMPDHEEELRANNKTFGHLNKKYKDVLKAHKDGDIDDDDLDEWKASLKHQVEDIIYQVGELSLVVRELKEPLRDYFIKNFKPAIADTMFNKEYDEAEEPYDVIKNRCFQLIGKIIGEDL